MNAENQLSILLVDDHQLIRDGTRGRLQASEPTAKIREAGDFDSALALLQNEHFDVTFLDYNLNDVRTGLDLLKEVRYGEIETRVIMLSGAAEKDIILECIQEGAVGYVDKEMPAEALLQALETVFAGRIFLPAEVFGRGGYSPTAAPKKQEATAESLGLSDRLFETLYWVCQGYSNKLVARKMGISDDTVRKDYVGKLLQKFRVTTRAELIVEVSRRGLAIHLPTDSQEVSG